MTRTDRDKGTARQDLFDVCLSLKHVHVVRFEKFIVTEATVYTVMERCWGQELPKYLDGRGGHLAPSHALELAIQVLSAISAIHGVQVMHRDIKTENFRFSEPSARTLKLLDFGFAKRCPGFDAQHTVTGTLVYAAPEVLARGVYSRRCDDWSAGVLIYLMLCGRLPFCAADTTMLRSMHLDAVLVRDCLFRGSGWAEVPAQVLDALRGLLTVDPAHRLTAAEASSRLRSGSPCGSPCGSPGPARAPEPRHASGLKRSGGASMDLCATGADD